MTIRIFYSRDAWRRRGRSRGAPLGAGARDAATRPGDGPSSGGLVAVAVDDESDVGAADADIAQHTVVERGELVDGAVALEGAHGADDKRHHEGMGTGLVIGGGQRNGRHGKVLVGLERATAGLTAVPGDDDCRDHMAGRMRASR